MTESSRVDYTSLLKRRGLSYPLGATIRPDGINFSVFSKHCTEIELLLFDQPEDDAPAAVVHLHPAVNKTFHYWHVFVAGLKHGQAYAYRVHGKVNPESGERFDSSKVLIDPYARAVANWQRYDREAAKVFGHDNCKTALRSIAVDITNYDWEGDVSPRHPYAETVIYEMHVRGFTQNPNSGVHESKRGTFAGLVEKIPYLKRLGVTTLELMPVSFFDSQDAGGGLSNYWGYTPISFFAPHAPYSSDKSITGPLNEFRDLVKALHKEGIEVILDVVYNHTCEGNELGPTLCYKGLDNSIYYMLEKNGSYMNFSGCGNTIKANHPIPARLIIDSLRFWVSDMHVDGFRFDLASVLSRDIYGRPIEMAPTLAMIESDPILAGAKLIAEAWDSGGLYQVGSFVNRGDWFAELNGPFRDDVRRFLKGDIGVDRRIGERIIGSPDIYHHQQREPNRSIHLITCHDGFTLNDLVSYNQKHNEANRENNQDGTDLNYSWNCGIEGNTNDLDVERLRLQQIKNFLFFLFTSQGTPMLLMGDEVRRSQAGNNNAYCQDNELSWFNWDQTVNNAELLEYTRQLIALTQRMKTFRQSRILKTVEDPTDAHLIWHGVKLYEPDWSEYSHSLAYTLAEPSQDERLHVMINAYWEPLEFEISRVESECTWYKLIDTHDERQAIDLACTRAMEGTTVCVEPRSIVMLQALRQFRPGRAQHEDPQ